MLVDSRPPLSRRTFSSALVESHLQRAVANIHDGDAQTLFTNCFPATLDKSVFSYDLDLTEPNHAKALKCRSFIITGDIPAMWLRDASNQVLPYLEVLRSNRDPNLATASPPLNEDEAGKEWTRLYRLVLGTVLAEADCILLHPFSNAFIPPGSQACPGTDDWVHPPTPPSNSTSGDDLRVWESKYELDSLASFVHLSHSLATASGRYDFLYHTNWREACDLAIKVCRLQQRSTEEEVQLLPTPWYGPGKEDRSRSLDEDNGNRVFDWDGKDGVYRFERETTLGSETRSLGGMGEPARRCGLIRSAFRPSDDSTVLPFLIPANAFLSVSLLKLADVVSDAITKLPSDTSIDPLKLMGIEGKLRLLGNEVKEAVWKEGVISIEIDGQMERVFAYEVDGYFTPTYFQGLDFVPLKLMAIVVTGSSLIADDANLPSLLSLPHLGFVTFDDPVYLATRKILLSKRNKWYFEGKVGAGIGGMHIGENFVWPMSIITQALTSDDDEEILDCLQTLKTTTAGTGLIHESFHVNNANNFTRSNFAWACGYYSQLILHLLDTKPYLL